MGLADDLRALSSDDLAKLLTARPELADPPPATMTDLANHASAPYSVARCVNALNRFSMQVLHGVLLFDGHGSAQRLIELSQEPIAAKLVLDELYRLRTLGLVTVHHDLWRLPAGVNRVLGRPFGLGETLEHSFDRHGPADLRVIAENLGLEPVVGKVGLIRMISSHLRDPVALTKLLQRLPPVTVQLLRDSISAGNSVLNVPGLMQRMRVPIEAAQLLSHGLIVPLDWDQAEIPREISLLLLNGKPIPRFYAAATPVLGGGSRLEDERVAPATLVDHVARLIYRLTEQPATLLKAGGIGVTVMKLLAKELGLEIRLATRVVCLAGMARLVAVDVYKSEATTTPKGHEWLTLDGPSQWMTLIEGWRTATFDLGPYLAEEQPVAPLRVDGMQIDSPWRRARLLSALDHSDYDGPVNLQSLVDHMLWDGAARWSGLDSDPMSVVSGLLGDLNVLGLLKDDQTTPACRALLLGDAVRVRELVADEFPAITDTFTVQGDLTAIAPGELRADVASELGVLADVESRGGATMLRFSDASLQRAMDRGRSPEAILDFLQRHARPSVPQTLKVLIGDVGRRHGRLRTGKATSYLRADDPAVLAGAVNSRKLAKARLRLLAPTVAISELEPAKLLKALRDAGFAPMPEDGGGNVISVALEAASRRVFTRELPDRYAFDAERAWSTGLAGADIAALQPSTPVSKLADRLRAGRA
jgi:hypothetical protein